MGNIDCDEIYMDLYGGTILKEQLTGTHNVLKLKR